MTVSFSARLYSRITGQPSSSSPSVSMRPACVLPVEYSDARNRTPSNSSRFRSISVCRDFSSPTAEPSSSLALPPSMRYSLAALISTALPVP